jgi:hypothetical protein
MTQRSPSAAEAVYPHLRNQVSEPREQRTSNSVAARIYPALAPKPPTPSDPRRRLSITIPPYARALRQRMVVAPGQPCRDSRALQTSP